MNSALSRDRLMPQREKHASVALIGGSLLLASFLVGLGLEPRYSEATKKLITRR